MKNLNYRKNIQNFTKILQKLARFSKIVYNYIRNVVMRKMMMIIKIFIIFVVSTLIIVETNIVYADNGNQKQPSQWSTKSSDYWKPDDEFGGEYEINYKAKRVLGIIRNLGIIVSVIALMIIGIREITASVEEKSIIKASLPGYILGVVLIAAVTILPSLIYELTKDLH